MLHFRMDMPMYLMALYGSIMIVIVVLLRGFLRNRLPKFVFPLLWSFVLIRLLVPFSLSSPISRPVPEWLPQLSNNQTAYTRDLTEGTAASTASNISEATAAPAAGGSPGETAEAGTDTAEAAAYSVAESTDHLTPNWQLVLIIVFSLGVIVTAGILLAQKYRYSRKLKNSLLLEHNQTINLILRKMGMGHVLVFTNDEIASPLVSGIFHPRIYLPSGMDFQQPKLLRHILTHEIMHIKRRDNWQKAVMLPALCLNWYNPLVWLMSKLLSSDLEAACDAAVLRQLDTDERKSYAESLLFMAITGNRSTLLYSAFSRTEVERRIKNVLNYRKTSAFILAFSMFLLLSSAVVFASAGQAPFTSDLSSYCGSTSSHWGVKAVLARDIALGEDAGRRADRAIIDVLLSDRTNDPDIITDQVKAALAKEFKVEKNAFRFQVDLNLMEEEMLQEYAKYGITKGRDGFYLYKGEMVRTYEDEMLGSVQTRETGAVDISVHRDRLGEIISVMVFKQGDKEFDQRTGEIEQNRRYGTDTFYSKASSQDNEPLVEQSTAVRAVTERGVLKEQ